MCLIIGNLKRPVFLLLSIIRNDQIFLFLLKGYEIGTFDLRVKQFLIVLTFSVQTFVLSGRFNRQLSVYVNIRSSDMWKCLR